MSLFTAAFCFAVFGLAGHAQTSSPSAPAAQQAPQPNAPAPSSAPAQTEQNPPPLQLHNLPAEPHTLTPQEQAQQQRERILSAAGRLATMQAQWGPESSTKGYSIALKEVGRTKAGDGTTQLTYQITGSGFPMEESLQLIRWPLDSRPQALMSGVRVNSEGIAICGAAKAADQSAVDTAPSTQAPATNARPSGPTPQAPAPSSNPEVQSPSCAATTKAGQPVEIHASVAQGEAVRVALVGQTEKNGTPTRIGAAASLVPFPMANTDKGCTMQVIRSMKDAGLVLVEGTGFPNNAAMKVDTTTEGATRSISTHTNADGRFVIAVVPGLNGHDQGDTTVHFGGLSHVPSLEDSKTPPPADPACNPSVTFHWGGGSYKLQ